MLSQVRRRKLTLPDSAIEIALLDWGGEGPLALLHHANGFCAGAWGPVAELLSDHYRVIAIDARGHGDSSKPEGADCYRWELFGRDVLAVAELLAAEHPDGRIALGLGHSFGGKWSLFASCLYDKFACAAWSDAGIVFDERDRRKETPGGSVNYWDRWYLGFELGSVNDPDGPRYSVIRLKPTPETNDPASIW